MARPYRRILLRRDTAEQWAIDNPTLADGEPGWDTTNEQLKIGDGTTPWDSLTPIGGTGGISGSNLTAEQVRDIVASALREGSNVTITVDDNANTITIASTGGGGGGGGVITVAGRGGAVVLAVADITDAGTAATADLGTSGSLIPNATQVDAKIAAVIGTGGSQVPTNTQVDAKITAKIGTGPTQVPTNTTVDARFTALVAAAPGALDTLGELAAALEDGDDAVAALTTTVSGKLAKDQNLADVLDPAAALANLGGITTADAEALIAAGTGRDVFTAYAAMGTNWDLATDTIPGGVPDDSRIWLIGQDDNAETGFYTIDLGTRLLVIDDTQPLDGTHDGALLWIYRLFMTPADIPNTPVYQTAMLYGIWAQSASFCTLVPLSDGGYSLGQLQASLGSAAQADLGSGPDEVPTNSDIDTRFEALIAAAPEALDTLGELAAQLADDEDAVAALVTTVAGKLPTANRDDSTDFADDSAVNVPSRHAVKGFVETQLGFYIPKSLFDANTVIVADVDNTPTALTLGASTVLGRKASGGIVALSMAELNAMTGGGSSNWAILKDQSLATLSTLDTDVTGYRHIRWKILGATARAATSDAISMRFNADTGAHYSREGTASLTFINVGTLAGSQTNTNRIGQIVGSITFGSSQYTTGESSNSYMNSTGTGVLAHPTAVAYGWDGTLTAAAVSMTLFSATVSAFNAGARILVEGRT